MAPEDRLVAVGPIGLEERTEALRRLAREPRVNLFLMELVDQLGRRPPPAEPRARIVVARRGGEIRALAAERPTVVIEAGPEEAALDALVDRLGRLRTGLIRSPAPGAGRLWDELVKHGRQPLVDRAETAFALDPAGLRRDPGPSGARWRRAGDPDLAALVEAARASLREEGRPDPFEGDPRGFRHWVRMRLERALVGEVEGRVVFVGYADVRRPEGWLLQGVYTWPEWRRRGLARAGVSALCAEAFARGAEHVQLSVVEGNDSAVRLYEQLGFRPFVSLRTVLFV